MMDFNYDAICANRATMNKKVFDLGQGMTLEYWAEDEFEITVPALKSQITKREKVAMMLYFMIKTMNPTRERIADIAEVCRKKVAETKF